MNHEDGTMKKRWWLPLAALGVMAHVLLILRSYPPGLLLGGEIPLKGDLSRYFATAHGFSNVSGLYGYDPYFMAGYPVGLWNSMGKEGFSLLHLLLPWISLPALFYLVAVVLVFAGPFLVWFAFRPFCEGERRLVLLLLLLLVYWHLDAQVAYFWNFGNVFFPLTCAFLPLIFLCAWNILNDRRTAASTIGLGLLTATVFYFHTVVMLALALGLIFCLWFNRDRLGRGKVWISFVISFLLFLVLVWPWLIPLLRNLRDYQPYACAGFQGTWKHLVMDVFSDRAYRHHFDRNLLLHAAAIAGLAGIGLSLRAPGGRFMACLGACGIGCLGVAYTFSHITILQAVHPYRFLVPAILLLLGPAAIFWDWALDRFRDASREARIVMVVLAAILAPAFTAYWIDLAQGREERGLSPAQRVVMEELQAWPGQGRILCDDIHLAHMIPYYCRIPVIGGLSAEAFTRHGFAGVDYDGNLFGRPVDRWTAEELRTYLDTYAIDRAIFVRPDFIGMAETPGSPFVLRKKEAGYAFFVVKEAKPSYLLKGTSAAEAAVTADYDWIRVKGVQGTEAVLKFHYADWLAADHDVRLEPIPVLDDPVPFMKCVVPAGVTEFTIGKQKQK